MYELKNVSFLTNSRVLILNKTIITFRFQPEKNKKRIFAQNLDVFMLLRKFMKLHKFKFEGVEIKYNNGMFKFQPENTQIKHFVS